MRRNSTAFLLAANALISLALVSGSSAEHVPGYRLVVDEATATSVAGADPGRFGWSQPPIRTLAPAREVAAGEISAMLAANEETSGPLRAGIVRDRREAPVSFDLSSTKSDIGALAFTAAGVVWSGRIRVEDAWAVRVRLDAVELPARTQIWAVSEVGGADDEPLVLGPMTLELVSPAGSLWLPPVPGPEVVIEVHVPRSALLEGAAVRFVVSRVDELFDIGSPDLLQEFGPHDPRGERRGDWEACRIDATCVAPATFGVVANVREAVALLLFAQGAGQSFCSGALLADVWQSGTPYLLTANHCFDDQEEASSLTSYFDYRSDACNAEPPDYWTRPQVSGSTLLATGSTGDFTLVQLTSNPSGVVHFLGWTPDRPASGEILHTVTHPLVRAQSYASSIYFAEGETGTCPLFDDQRDAYHKSTALEGSTVSGSSGGAVIVDRSGGLVVGEINGTCHVPPPSIDECDGSTFDNIFGSFEAAHFWVRPWLGEEFVADEVFSDGFESGTVDEWQV